MNILFETETLRLTHEYESVFLIEKTTGKILFEDNFYGDPNCGLVDKEGKWAIIAGEHLTIWTPKRISRLDNSEIHWIHSVRIKNSEIVEILTDPWKKNSAIWEIHPINFETKKIRDFNDYKNLEYSESVNW